MRIGQYQISGVSTRFWIILGAAVVVVIGFFFLRPSNDVDPLATPAFAASELQASDEALQTGWLDAEETFTADTSTAISEQYTATLGAAYRLRVYLPNDEEGRETRPDLYFNSKAGYNFVPASVLSTKKTYNEATLSEDAVNQLASDTPVQLAFQANKQPPTAKAYEITGMLWWNSQNIGDNGASLEETGYGSAPTIIVDRYRELSSNELRAPSTQFYNLGLIYREKNLEMRIPRIEWSSGREVRACMLIKNLSARPVSLTPLATQMTADVGLGETEGSFVENSPLGQGTMLAPGQTIPSYMAFNDSVADSTKPLTLRLKSALVANTKNVKAATNSQSIFVDPQTITEVSSADQGKLQENACAANTAPQTAPTQTQKVETKVPTSAPTEDSSSQSLLGRR